MITEVLTATYDMFVEMAPYMMLGLIFVGVLHIFVTKDFVAKQLGKKDVWSVIKASLFGVPLPLCSCGVIPTSVFMHQNGASKGSTVSFLISTPQTGIDSIIATYGMMGWVYAIYRPFAALFMGLIGGLFTHSLDKTKEKDIETHAPNFSMELGQFKPKETIKDKFRKMWDYAFVEFLDDIALQFIVGVFISGLIYYFVPEDMFADSIVSSGIVGMLAMIVIGIPMYICATASIPIAVTLMLKGFSPGVAFVFLAVGPATNAASLAIIINSIGKKVAVGYLLSIIITSIIFGYLLDTIFSASGIDPKSQLVNLHQHDMLINHELKLVLAGIFFILLMASIYRKYLRDKFKKNTMADVSKKKFEIEGMSCNHCVANVKKAIESVEGVSGADVNLSENSAYVEGDFDKSKLIKSVEDVGYKVVTN